jgi:hypothetical protein
MNNEINQHPNEDPINKELMAMASTIDKANKGTENRGSSAKKKPDSAKSKSKSPKDKLKSKSLGKDENAAPMPSKLLSCF